MEPGRAGAPTLRRIDRKTAMNEIIATEVVWLMSRIYVAGSNRDGGEVSFCVLRAGDNLLIAEGDEFVVDLEHPQVYWRSRDVLRHINGADLLLRVGELNVPLEAL